MEPDDLVSIDYPHEAELAVKLGYVLKCTVGSTEHGVVKTRRVGQGFEVLIGGHGWRTPERCWAVLEAKPVEVEQGGLFE